MASKRNLPWLESFSCPASWLSEDAPAPEMVLRRPSKNVLFWAATAEAIAKRARNIFVIVHVGEGEA